MIARKAHWGSAAALLSPTDPTALAWLNAALEDQPACVIDASGPNQFAFSGGWASLANQPLGARLLTHYDEVFSSPNYRVYRLAPSG